ncbi:hypothetical protein [Ekhidna sp.]|jgi:hypothetical protein|uniref:hypothetical protein n=1 Tax=Ekhidna sp. TaxID=2608089 RepID=UPI0032EB2EBD
MKNLYFRKVIRRDNMLLKFISDVLQLIEKPPRLLLSVFLRKDFGERNFNIVSASSLAFVLTLPFLGYLFMLIKSGATFGWLSMFNFFWLAFIIAFMFMSYRHHKTMGFSLTKYDFDKFSLKEGQYNLPWDKILLKVNIKDRLSPIIAEVVAEPILCFMIGFVLMIIPFTRGVGILIMISSVIYGLSYLGAYWRSRNSILDRNDERIMNEDMAKVFLGDIDMPELPENTRIKLPPIIPTKKKNKEGLYNQIVVEKRGVS